MSVKDLYYPRSEHSVDFDWDEVTSTEWTYWEGFQYSGTQSVVFANNDGTWTRHNRRGAELPGELSSVEQLDLLSEMSPEGPQMTFYWPLGPWLGDQEPREVAARLALLPVCLVQVGDTYGIALTGGGMDLSWQLALAAVTAGFYPWMGLDISQGSPASTWEYGVGQVSESGARKVRAALRARLRAAKRQAQYQLNRMADWK